MVTILLSGGLGNQMFQYAAGKALATRLNVPLAIDLFYYSKKTKATQRRFELDIFNTELNFKSDLRNRIFVKYKPYFLRHPKLVHKFHIFSDLHAMVYEDEFEKLCNHNTILAGYFQNEQYFKSVEPIIRTDFKFKKPLNGNNADIAKEILSTQSIAVHIRRGDYVNDPSVNLAVCGVDYYERAIDFILKEIPNPSFFIFSDDIKWAKNNLDFRGFMPSYIDWNIGEKSYVDMQLMSLCKHNIIANSSFSWWGAWLNQNSEKIVISPQKWFKNNLLYENYEYKCIPEDWIRI